MVTQIQWQLQSNMKTGGTIQYLIANRLLQNICPVTGSQLCTVVMSHEFHKKRSLLITPLSQQFCDAFKILYQHQPSLSPHTRTVFGFQNIAMMGFLSLSRLVVYVVGGELAVRPHPEVGGKWLLFKLTTCHKWAPSGIDIGPNTV